MITSHSYVLLLVIQVTVISIIAIAMICAVMRSAARRHTIALSALALVMLSPLVTWLLPVRWQGFVTISSGVAEPVAAMFSGTERSADLVLPTSGDTLRADFIAETTTETNAAAALSPGSEPQPAAPLASSIATPDVLHSLTSSPSIVPIRSIGGARSPWVQSLFSALIAIWLIGAIIGAVRWVCRRRQLYSAVKTLQPISAVVLSSSVVQTICEALQIHELPAVCTSRMIPSPVVLGVLRPVVVLPEPLVDELSEQELSSVLIHECAHIVRDDHWIHAMQQIVGIVWWFHPGVLVLSRILSRSREEVCDNYVLRQLPAAEFARTLLELTERCGTTRPVLSLLGIFGKHWSLESRVTELLNPERNMMLRTEPRWKTAIVSVLCICCLFVGGVSAVQKTNSETKQSATPTAPEPQEFNTSPKTDNAPQAEEPNPAAEPQPKASTVEASGITLEGTCRVKDSESPVAARVRVFYIPSYAEAAQLVAEAIADDEGRFGFRGLKAPGEDSTTDQRYRWLVIATAPGYSSTSAQPTVFKSDDEDADIELKLSDAPASLSGVVRDASGGPVQGANVFAFCGSLYPIPGFGSTVTDAFGRYEITDLASWNSKDTLTFDKNTGLGTRVAYYLFTIQHPDFPTTRAKYSAAPQVVDVTLRPPAVIEGQVVDVVTGEPVPDVQVQAQGVVGSESYAVQTDENGRYSLRMTRDHYNIWAVQPDRMPLAIKALKAEPGVQSGGHDIHMVRGGLVKGRILTPSGEPAPIPKGYASHVAHHGPARPRTGAAVTSTPINADGTFRLHVAPGRNYIYVMGDGAAAFVEVGDGMEVEQDLVVGVGTGSPFTADDPDETLAHRLREEARLEDKEHARVDKTNHSPGADARKARPTVERLAADNPAQYRMRRDTPTGKLLTKLENMNRSLLHLKEPWARLMRELVNLGPEAVPELITELDATNDERMLQCLGFSLRAIGDKRAIPALISAIPKMLRPFSSDYGDRIEDDETLQKFMQKHDLNAKDDGNKYSVGRPVREVFGALESLTGENFNDDELFGIFRGGTDSQNHAKEVLFHRNAAQWRDWWEQTGAADVADPAYKKVNLAPQPIAVLTTAPVDGNMKLNGRSSNRMLHSIHELNARPNPLYDIDFEQLYDLDTGRYAALPQKWRGRVLSADDIADITKWAAEEGFDMMGDEYKDSDGNGIYSIRGIGLKAWQLPDTRWKSLPSEFTVAQLQTEGRRVIDNWLLFKDSVTGTLDLQRHAPFYFVTREGTPGIIYVGIPVVDDSLKPGGLTSGDDELDPVAFSKGRRFGIDGLVPIAGNE